MEDKCPICFELLEFKDKARPNICDHIFCLSCLNKWTKFGSFCPVDRKRYTKVINLCSDDIIQVSRYKRKGRKRRRRVLYDVSAYCEICGNSHDTNTLLLCDSCDLGYHCSCLNPPLPAVPPGVWHCPVCVAIEEKLRNRKGNTTEKGEHSRHEIERKPEMEEYGGKKRETIQREEKRMKTDLDEKTERYIKEAMTNKPVVVLKKLTIHDFIPPIYARSSKTKVWNTCDDSYIKTKNSLSEATLNAISDIKSSSQNAVANEGVANNIVNDSKMFLRQNTNVDKSEAKCLPSTSQNAVNEGAFNNINDMKTCTTLNTSQNAVANEGVANNIVNDSKMHLRQNTDVYKSESKCLPSSHSGPSNRVTHAVKNKSSNFPYRPMNCKIHGPSKATANADAKYLPSTSQNAVACHEIRKQHNAFDRSNAFGQFCPPVASESCHKWKKYHYVYNYRILDSDINQTNAQFSAFKYLNGSDVSSQFKTVSGINYYFVGYHV